MENSLCSYEIQLLDNQKEIIQKQRDLLFLLIRKFNKYLLYKVA